MLLCTCIKLKGHSEILLGGLSFSFLFASISKSQHKAIKKQNNFTVNLGKLTNRVHQTLHLPRIDGFIHYTRACLWYEFM